MLFMLLSSLAGEVRAEAPLERAALVQQVLARNPTLAADTARARAAGARADGVALPDATVEVMAAPGTLAGGIPGVRVTARQGFSFPGKLASEREVLGAEARAADGEVATTRLQLAKAASQLYDRYWLADRMLAFYDEEAALLDQVAASSRAAYEAGRGELAATLRAEAERAELETRKLDAAADREIAIAGLLRLLRLPPGAPLAPPPEALPPVPVTGEHFGVGHPRLEELPEVVTADAKKSAAEAEVVQARRAWLPDLGVMAQYDGMWADPADRWMVGVEVGVPLDTRGRRADVAAAQAELDAAEARAWVARDEVADMGEQARIGGEKALLNAKIYADRILPVRTRELEAARAALAAGQGDLGMVLEAARGVLDAKVALAKLQAEASTMAAERACAVGDLPGGEQ